MSEAFWFWRQAVCDEHLDNGDDRLAAAWRAKVSDKPSMFDVALASGLRTLTVEKYDFCYEMARARAKRGI